MRDAPPLTPTKSSGCLPWIVLIGFLVAAIFMAINVFLSWKGSSDSPIMSPSNLIKNIKSVAPTLPFLRTFTSSPSASSAPVPSTPAPTTTPISINKSINIQIQNGTKDVGIASQIKIALQAAGYLNVTIGSSQKYDYDQTVVMQKSGFETDSMNIRKTISGISSVDPENNIVNPSSSYEIIIIVGKNGP